VLRPVKRPADIISMVKHAVEVEEMSFTPQERVQRAMMRIMGGTAGEAVQ